MKTSRLHKGIFAVVSALFFLYMLTLIFPFVWMLLNSLKTNMDFFKDIWSLPEKPLLSNYVNVWDQMNLLVYFGNSIKLTLLGTLASILTASMASYVIAKYKFKLSKLLYTMAIVVMLMASATAISGVTLQLDENAVDILDKQVENRAGYIQDQLQQAQELTDLSTYINETAQQMLDWGMVSEVVPKDQVMDRAWEIARMWKTMPYENRTIMSNLAKRPLKKLFVEDLKLHTVSEQYGSLLRIAAGELGDTNAGQQDEKYISQTNDWRYCHDWMQQPPSRESWAGFRTKPFEWFKEVEAGKEVNPFDPNKKVTPYRPGKSEK